MNPGTSPAPPRPVFICQRVTAQEARVSGGARKGKSQRRGGENSDNVTGLVSPSVAMWHDTMVSELRPKTKHTAVVSLTCAIGREMWPRTTHFRQVTIQDQL